MPDFTMLPSLLNLHQIDNELHELEHRLNTLLKDQVAAKADINRIKDEILEMESAGRKIQATMAAHELDIKARQEHVEKMRTSLNTTKTNKEYSAILVQISAEKAENKKVEDVVLECMEQQQKNGENLQSAHRQLAAAEAALAELQKLNAQRVGEIESRMQKLRESRRIALAKIPRDAAQQYERIRKKYPGQVMAPVEFDDNNLDTITCGGCFMSLNMEDVNLLRGRDEVRRCHSCGRILYLPEMIPHDVISPG